MTTIAADIDTVVEPVSDEPVALFNFKTIDAPFTVDGNKVVIRSKTIIEHIGNVTILNTTVRQSLSAAENETFDNMMVELMQSGRTIQRHANLRDFFNGSLQFGKMMAQTSEQNLKLADDLAMPLSSTDIAIMAGYESLKERICDFFAGLVTKTPYSFVENTRNDAPLQIGRAVKGRNRVRTPSGYWISETNARRLWDRARAVWSGEVDRDDGNGTLRHDSYTRRIEINTASATVGCQTMTRWQVEQAAVDLGFIER